MASVFVLYAPLFVGAWFADRRRGGQDASARNRISRQLVERLGPTAVKIAQVAAARPDLLPPSVCAEFSELHDNVKPLPWHKVQKIIEKSVGHTDAVFTAINRSPLGSGCIAQVHSATLASGHPVALKIRRPAVAADLLRDLAIASFFVRVVSRAGRLRQFPLREGFAEIQKALIQQIDFQAEADVMAEIHGLLDAGGLVRIPRPIPELSGRDVLVMDLIEGGRRITDTGCIERVLRALYLMIFEFGVVHADLHPGNMLDCGDGVPWLVDFGLVARLNRNDRRDFSDLFFALVTNDSTLCAAVLLRQSISVPEDLDASAWKTSVASVVRGHYEKDAAKFEASIVAFELFDLQRKFGISGSAAFATTILAIVGLESVVKSIAPSLDFQAVARSALIPLKATQFPRRPWTTKVYDEYGQLRKIRPEKVGGQGEDSSTIAVGTRHAHG